MKPQRFELALERLKSGDWARFERFASQFLAFDFAGLRTVASKAGDLGRDSELFSPDGDPSVLLQYSVTESWASKIRQTAKRIRENFPDASVLVYATNQQIGADGDYLKKELRKDYRLVLDIHDRGWFLDRMSNPPERTRVAETLAREVVDQFLEERQVIDASSPALNEFESKAAVLHLQLQWEDNSREKGLTKLCYEGLVKSVLRDTSSEKRMKVQTVREAVKKLLPNVPPEAVSNYVDSAINRLEKKIIKKWQAEDEICLSHEEVLKVREGVVGKEVQDNALMTELQKTISDFIGKPTDAAKLQLLSVRARRVLDHFLLRKGEEFASAVANNRSIAISGDTVDLIVTNDFGTHKDETALGESAVRAVRLAVVEVLQRSSPQVQRYLRQIADGYTLFGFLRAVPDVQKVVQKIFADGEIWIDTSILLPVIAETLLEDNEQVASRLLRAARDAGLRLRVTSGVIEEVEKHINRCKTYTRTPVGQWRGGVPFLFAMHSIGGNSQEGFPSWINNFCGDQRPRDDIADYFLDEWGIAVSDLHDLVQSTPEKLRSEVERIWREAHEERRTSGQLEYDSFVIDRLTSHDVECFLGVIGKRQGVSSNHLGHIHWWLTLDKTVRDIERKLYEVIGSEAPKAPVMSPDFLSDYLAVGPLRSKVTKQTEVNLPLAVFDIMADQIPVELLDLASGVRTDCGELDERLLRRRLRDTLDNIKRTRGELAAGGFAEIKANLERALKARKRP